MASTAESRWKRTLTAMLCRLVRTTKRAPDYSHPAHGKTRLRSSADIVTFIEHY
jgi:hypothetical protein